jgi:putative addiction module component (TIGR02574 family)
MSGEARKLLRAVLRLPLRDRALFAGSLIESLDEKVDPDAGSAWADEVARRVKDLDSGRMKTVPWSDVRKKLRGKRVPSSDARR